jgi:hypothetical protein
LATATLATYLPYLPYCAAEAAFLATQQRIAITWRLE